MCLTLIFEIDKRDRDAAKQLRARLTDQPVLDIALLPARRWIGRKEPVLSVSEDGGCACSMLADDADWNAATWRLRCELLAKLGSTIRQVRQHLHGDLFFEALWAGTARRNTVDITLTELVALAEENLLSTSVRYRVLKAGRAS